jgi:hypothetical protein
MQQKKHITGSRFSAGSFWRNSNAGTSLSFMLHESHWAGVAIASALSDAAGTAEGADASDDAEVAEDADAMAAGPAKNSK